MSFLFNFLELLCEVLTIAILGRVIMSWFSQGPTNMLTRILYQVTEPILAPLRRIIPRVGMLDFSPLVAVILLQVIASLFFPMVGFYPETVVQIYRQAQN